MVDGHGEYFYYNAKGKRVVLERDPHLYAVRLARGKHSDDASLSRESRQFLRDESEHVHFVPSYNLQVYRGKLDPPNIARKVRDVNGEDAVEFASPVFRRSNDDADLVYLLNRFVVEFDDQIDSDDCLLYTSPSPRDS